MEHNQPSMLNFCVLDEYLELKSRDSGSVAMDDQRINSEKLIGFVEIHIHQARDIHNICIYQNQDVYAKFCFTDKPEKKISSKVINGGGKNPIFNETLKLNIQKMDSSLRCEVWMLSRIRNYLEDQLLGFATVPLSDVVSESGKSPKEFELSSSEIFHSPAGYVELSFKYSGTSSEVTETYAASSCSSVANVVDGDDVKIHCDELDRIEFPDQETANQNERMVSECLRFPCDQNDDDNQSVKTEVQSLEKGDHAEQGDNDSTTSVPSKSVQFENVPIHKDSGISAKVSSTTEPLIKVRSVESEEKVVVQEEIVDMYMKGMQQFTDALAKMKLPMDIGDGSSLEKDSSKREDRGSDEKTQASKSPPPDPSTRVFYGSRAFF